MNCCDYNCNQGRDCPARVAKIGRRIPGAEPLPESSWRRQLRHLAYWMLMGVIGLCWLSFLMWAVHA